MDNMLVIIRGLPGSGKSTLARNEFYTYVHLEADMYHMVAGEYKFVGDRVHLAHKWCQETCRIFLNSGLSVVVSNTFTTLKEIQPYADMAQELGIPMHVYRMTENYGSIHNVPVDVIEKMKNRFQPFEGEKEYG